MLDIAKGLGVGLLAATGAWFLGQHLGFNRGESEERARQEGIIAKLQLDASERQNEMLTAYRSMEQLANTALKEKQDVYDEAQAQRDIDRAADLRSHSADLDILRKRLAKIFTCTTPTTPGDPVPSAGETAAAIGGVLSEALQIQAELAEGAERNADAVRLLLADWAAMKAALTPKPALEAQ